MDTSACDRRMILQNLRARPSVASAIAIGHFHVLNGAPISIALEGLDAMAEMPCDWTVAILERVMRDPTRRPVVRRRAVSKVRSLLFEAVNRGYSRVSRGQIRDMARDACRAVEVNGSDEEDVPVIDDLCSHLDQAIVDGLFDTIPNE